MPPTDQTTSDNQLPSPISDIPDPAQDQPSNSDQPPIDDDSADISNLSGPESEGALATHHLSADDLDLIEKEWVMKAKEVVDHTQGDPYLQTRELNKIKADYIKKRYNRDIKPNE